MSSFTASGSPPATHDADERRALERLIRAGHIHDSGYDVSATEQLLWSLYLGRSEYRRERLGLHSPPTEAAAIRNLTPTRTET